MIFGQIVMIKVHNHYIGLIVMVFLLFVAFFESIVMILVNNFELMIMVFR